MSLNLAKSQENFCPITSSPMKHVFIARILNRYDVNYFYSEVSGLLRTETPYWLEDAYGNAIPELDVGILQRNATNADLLPLILEILGWSNETLVDVACGYGILTRMLRDRGFDCYGFDKYCQNLFAKHFEPKPNLKAKVLFAFEALEHIFEPISFLEEIFERFSCRNLVFSTLTFEESIPAKDWWYYSFETGQHISFYQPRTLAAMAEKLGCFYLKINPGFHLYTEKPISAMQQKLLTSSRWQRIYRLWYHRFRAPKRVGKIWEDYCLIRQQATNIYE